MEDLCDFTGRYAPTSSFEAEEEAAEGDGEEADGEEGEEEGEKEDEGKDDKDEEEEFSEEGQWKYGESFGAAWKEGDVIGVLFDAKDGTANLSFSLNGSLAAPMGQAFTIDLAEDMTLAMVLASGDEGEINVNLGQRLFQTCPSVQEGEEEPRAVRGLGEAMRMRPAWKVQLPKGVKDKVEVDQLHSAEDNWVQIMEGWVQTRMLVAGTEYEALKLFGGIETTRQAAATVEPGGSSTKEERSQLLLRKFSPSFSPMGFGSM
ncbi:unnamed protein product [Symbiodinium necroappetens]|uniref:B30.2/SPRY domain-containing protein n=1 Tax=Symbiodinium necroappetens TaxID=1628268 RepID=A0A812X439_9DINO|nr:unnamed protein product [Symbiodinium necroappetens]